MKQQHSPRRDVQGNFPWLCKPIIDAIKQIPCQCEIDVYINLVCCPSAFLSAFFVLLRWNLKVSMIQSVRRMTGFKCRRTAPGFCLHSIFILVAVTFFVSSTGLGLSRHWFFSLHPWHTWSENLQCWSANPQTNAKNSTEGKDLTLGFAFAFILAFPFPLPFAAGSSPLGLAAATPPAATAVPVTAAAAAFGSSLQGKVDLSIHVLFSVHCTLWIWIPTNYVFNICIYVCIYVYFLCLLCPLHWVPPNCICFDWKSVKKSGPPPQTKKLDHKAWTNQWSREGNAPSQQTIQLWCHSCKYWKKRITKNVSGDFLS